MVRSFVDLLPPESCTKTAMRDDLTPEQLADMAKVEPEGAGTWSHSDMLLAAVYDRLGSVMSVIFASQGHKYDAPPPYPRPGINMAAAVDIPASEREWIEQIREQDRQARIAAGTERPSGGVLTPAALARIQETLSETD